MRVLWDAAGRFGGELDDEALSAAYADEAPGLRGNMVSTLDGAATGESGLSGSINDEADGRVFACLRAWADAVLVGSSTARAEEYGPLDRQPLVLLSRRGEIPDRLRSAEPGQVLLATVAASPGLAQAREVLGPDQVLVCGESELDLPRLRDLLHGLGHARLLSEGGPSILRAMLAAGVLEELCLTWVPRLLAGEHPRILSGAGIEVSASPRLLVEQDGTLLGRWRVETRSTEPVGSAD